MIGTDPFLKQKEDPEAFREMQPTVVVLVKYGATSLWHEIEKQI